MPTNKPQGTNGAGMVWGKRKNKKWIGIVVAIIVAAAAGGGYLLFGLDLDSGGSSNTLSGSSDQLTRRAIDGVMVAPDEANPYPVAVIIENLTVARPQSGLATANVVYEALAEGGITRFLAVFAGKTPGTIGPVRSARPYFVDWVLEYQALFAHAGGSPQALVDITTNDVFDLNQFYHSQYFYRDKSRNVASEHTLFTTGENLAFALRDLEAAEHGTFDSWKFKDDAALADRPLDAKSISIDFSSFSYSVSYQYNREENSYVRSMAGQIHADADGTEIHAKNIIVQKVETRLADEQRLSMDTVGSGEAIIFRDGQATMGTWEKEEKTSRTRFYDAEGDEVALNAGQTWIEVVPTDREVTYN